MTKIYLYRRIGNQEWATCDESRFIELSSHKLFTTKICYEAPLSPDHSGGAGEVVLPDGFMICERSIWTEAQVESATKCITMLKNAPGMTDRDLALAAMDAGQCTAPDITLADLACLDKVKELNQ